MDREKEQCPYNEGSACYTKKRGWDRWGWKQEEEKDDGKE